jgi:transcriptional regulator with XRE-family HTH domain
MSEQALYRLLAEAVGKAIREQRGGLSKRAFAHRLGMERTQLGRYEAGRFSPTLAVIWRIAKSCGIKPSELVAAIDDVVINESNYTTAEARTLGLFDE